MAGEIASLFVKLGLDASAFTAGLKGVEGAASGFAKSTLGLGNLGQAAFAGLGAAATAGFGAMTTGALQAQEAQGKFMAATGASREEAKAFVSEMDGLAGTSGAVGKSFEDIAATGTMVEQQFGTTGKATQDLTGYILDFSKVTGQDATGAAADLEDTLSSFGLTADDASGFMDQLVASNQKFGTDVGPQALSVLRNMSPALQAVGADIEDGVGFLNLFETAGLDAGAAATGLNKAIKTLKPGQTIDDLITQISDIEDPLERAQKAVQIFGSKAGPKLALAIKPGMTSLDDFTVSATDAKDATHDASENMVTDVDKIRAQFDKVLAGARELGQNFGPALSGLGALGSGLATIVGTLHMDKFVDALKEKLGAAIGKAWTLAQSAASKLVSAASDLALNAYQDALDLASVVKENILDAWTSVKIFAQDAIQKASFFARDAYAKALDIASAVGDALSTAWDAAKTIAHSAIQTAAQAAIAVYKTALKIAGAIGDALSSAWDAVVSIAQPFVKRAAEKAAGVYAAAAFAGQRLADAAETAWDFVAGAAQGAVKKAGDFLGALFGDSLADNFATTVTGAGGTIIGNLTGDLVKAITTSWTSVKEYLLQPGSLTQRAIAAAGAAASAVYAAAASVTSALIEGATALWSAIGKPGSKVINAAIAAGTLAGTSWVGAAVLTISTLGLAAIAKVGSDFLSDLGGKIGGVFATIFNPDKLVHFGTTAGQGISTATGNALTDYLSSDIGRAFRASEHEALPAIRDVGSDLAVAGSESVLDQLIDENIPEAWAKVLADQVANVDAEGILKGFADPMVQQAYESAKEIGDAIGNGVPQNVAIAFQTGGKKISDALYAVLHGLDFDVRANGPLASLYEKLNVPQALALQWASEGPFDLQKALSSVIMDANAGTRITDAVQQSVLDAAATQGLIPSAAAAIFEGKLDAQMRLIGLAGGKAVDDGLHDGLIAHSNEVSQAADKVRQDLQNALDPKKEAITAIGKETIDLFRKGMASADPQTKQDAEQLGLNALSALEKTVLKGNKGQRAAKDIGIYFDTLVANGMDANAIVAALAADGVSADAIQRLKDDYPQYFKVGETIPQKIAGGINRTAKTASDAASAMARDINAALDRIKTHIRVVVDVNDHGFGPAGHGHRKLGGPVKPNTMYEVTEGGRPEMLKSGSRNYLLMGGLGGYVSRIGNALMAGAQPMAAVGGGGEIVEVHIHGDGIDGLIKKVELRKRQTQRGATRQVGAF